jgi:signal transduction histidine kinase
MKTLQSKWIFFAKRFVTKTACRHQIIFILLSLIVHLQAVAQDKAVDSLTQVLAKASDTAKVNTLLLLVEATIYNTPDSALAFGSVALKLAEALDYRKGIGLALNKIGYAYERKSNAVEALRYQKLAQPILEEVGDKENLAWSWHNMGNAHSLRGDYQEALRAHFKALKIREEISSLRGSGWSYSAIALIYQRQGNFQEELRYQEKALGVMKEIGDNDGTGRTLSALGSLYSKKGEFKKAEQYLNDGLSMLVGSKNKMNYIYALTSGAEYYSSQKQYDKSLELCQKMLITSEAIGNKFVIAGSLKRIGETYFKQGKINQSLEVAEKINAKVHIRDISKTLAAIFEARKEYNQALRFYSRYSSLKDSLASVEAQNNIAKLQALYESEKKDKEIESLRLQDEKNHLLQNAMLVGFGLVIVIVVLMIRAYFLKRRQYKEVVKLNLLLDEKKRIAEDANELKSRLLSIAAHDLKNPIQSILGFSSLIRESIDSSRLIKKDEKDNLQNMMDVVIGASDRMRKLIDDLLESSVIENGIELHPQPTNLIDIARKSILASNVQAAFKSQTIHFESQGEDFIADIDSERMQQVFDNLVSNAVKYSPEKTTIQCILARYHPNVKKTERDPHLSFVPEPCLVFMVKDEGLGLTCDDLKKLFGKFQKLSARPTGGESSTGLGLSIVKQLVELHRGKVWAESEGKGKGSTFFVMIPSSASVIALSNDHA